MTATSADSRVVKMVVGGLRLHIFGLEKAGKLDPANLETRPDLSIVFVAHGRLGSSAKMHQFCEALVAKEPFVAIAFDQRNHGERLLDEAKNGAWENPSHVNDMYSVQYGTAKDISYLMDVLPAFLGFGPHSYGVVGVSLGGHVVLLSMAMDKRISFGVCIIGCGNYKALMTHRATVNSKGSEKLGEDPTLGGRMSVHLQELLTKVDPFHRYPEFKDRPVLFLSGGEDPLVPAACNNEFLDRLKGCYFHQDRLKVIVYPKVGHQVVPQMFPDTVEWCERWWAKL